MSSQETQAASDEMDTIPIDVVRDLADNFDAAANDFEASGEGARAEAYRRAAEYIREEVAEHSTDA